jgi:DNA-binding NarL/FixJ family response regulator
MGLKIVIAEHDETLRQSLRAALESRPGWEVAGETAHGPDAVDLARELAPDVALLDIEIPGFNAIEAIKEIAARFPGLKILALALQGDKRFVREALKAGASGYLLKYGMNEELLPAVEMVAAGGKYFSPGIDLSDTFPPKEAPLREVTFPFVKVHPHMKEAPMPNQKKVKELMIPLEDYPHIPYWFTLRQAMAIIREAAIKFEGSFEPRSVLVFDEKYQLMGILTLRDIIKGLEPKFLKETTLVKMDPSLTVLLGDLFGPNIKQESQKPVSEVMTPIKVTVDAEDPIAKAVYLMIKENVGMMPVMKDHKVAGMVRLSDLFNEISKLVLGE